MRSLQTCYFDCIISSLGIYCSKKIGNEKNTFFYKIIPEDELAKKDPRNKLKAVSMETRDVLDELDREYKAPVCLCFSSCFIH